MRTSSWRRTRIATGLAGVSILVLGTIIYSPAVLAFPHNASIGDVTVYSVVPIRPEIASILQSAEKRVATSPISAPLGPRSIFLTDGGYCRCRRHTAHLR